MRFRLESRFPLLAPFPNDAGQRALATATAKLAVEYPLPRAEVELPAHNRHDDFETYNLSFCVRLSIVFAGACVPCPVPRFRRYLYNSATYSP